MNALAKMPAGIYTMSAADYHADPADEPSLSNSLLKVLLTKTPRHAWLNHPRLNPNLKRVESSTFDIGSACHSLLLEGMDAAVVIDAEDWRTKDAKYLRDLAREEGKIPLLASQHAAVRDMLHAAHDYIETTSLRGIFSRGKPEQTVVWKDVTGVWCRAMVDWLTDDREIILDYKTTGLDGPGEWMRKQIIAHGYDTQSVWYPRALAAVGHRNARFLFLVQEVHAPFMCYLVEPAESMVELASHKIARGLPLWRDCLGSHRWPGYSINVHQAEAPVWAINEEESL